MANCPPMSDCHYTERLLVTRSDYAAATLKPIYLT